MCCASRALARVLWTLDTLSIAHATHGLPFMDSADGCSTQAKWWRLQRANRCVVGVVVVVKIVNVSSRAGSRHFPSAEHTWRGVRMTRSDESVCANRGEYQIVW